MFVDVAVAVAVAVNTGVPVDVAVGLAHPPPPVVPSIWNIWSGAVDSIPHVAALLPQLVHAGIPRPPPGFCHAAAVFDVTVLFDHPHCPPGVKSILACTDTQYVPAPSVTLDGSEIVNNPDAFV